MRNTHCNARPRLGYKWSPARTSLEYKRLHSAFRAQSGHRLQTGNIPSSPHPLLLSSPPLIGSFYLVIPWRLTLQSGLTDCRGKTYFYLLLYYFRLLFQDGSHGLVTSLEYKRLHSAFRAQSGHRLQHGNISSPPKHGAIT